MLLELLRCGLLNHHRRLAHHTAAVGLVEELRGLVEALALHESVLMIGFSLGFVKDLWSGIYGFWFDDWVLFLMLDDLDVLLLIWLGFDLLVLEICLG